MNRCPICHSDDCGEAQTHLYDDRYGYPGYFKLMECHSCDHLFLENQFTGEDLAHLYSNYYPRSSFKIEDYKHYTEIHGFSSWFNGELSSPFRWVPKKVKVLDIGCGFGETLGYHTSRGCDVYGVEVDSNISKVVEKFGFKVHVGLFDSSKYEANSFDVITMGQVLEHVKEPLPMLSGVAGILKPNGKLILSIPNAEGLGAKVFKKHWIHWHTPYHLHFFGRKNLELMAKNSGFEIEIIRTISPSMWLYIQFGHLLFYPKMGEKSLYWSMTPTGLSGTKKIVFKIINALYRFKFFHILSRLIDSLGLGDNRLVVLRKIK